MTIHKHLSKTKKIRLLKKRNHTKYQKRLYKYATKKDVKVAKKKCNDMSKHVGDWCTNQYLRNTLKNNKFLPTDSLNASEMYDLRDNYLNATINAIHKVFVASNKNINKNSLQIYSTGSTLAWSDKDVQISLNLYNNYTLDNLKKLTKIIKSTRKHNQQYFLKKTKKIFDTYYDINFYMPSLFHYIYLPKSQKAFIQKCEPHCYTNKPVIKSNHIEVQLVLKPDFTNDPGEFLYNDIIRCMLNINMQLSKCYERYINKPAKSLVTIINNIHSNTPFSINEHLSNITSINPICAEMYLSVCSTIYVVWYMQINNEKTHTAEQRTDLKYLAIPTVVENHIMYVETKKEKYNHRKLNALNHAHRPLLISLLEKAVKISGRGYSTKRINIVKNLLKELI